MNQLKPTIKAYLICIFGKRGSGKTTLIKGNLNNFPGPVVCLDILGNFNDESYIQLTSISETINNIKYYKENKDDPEINKIIVLKPSDPNLAVEYISSALWNAECGTLVIDEADAFSMSEAPCFDQLVRYGRNKGINIVTGCRRPAEISRNITAGANKIFIFQTQEPRDVDYFESTVLGKDAEKLMNLLQFHGLWLDYDERTTGEFKIDLSGEILKLNEKPLT